MCSFNAAAGVLCVHDANGTGGSYIVLEASPLGHPNNMRHPERKPDCFFHLAWLTRRYVTYLLHACVTCRICQVDNHPTNGARERGSDLSELPIPGSR